MTSERQLMQILLCSCYLILTLSVVITVTTKVSENKQSTKETQSSTVSLRNFSRSLVQCLGSDDKMKCLQMRVIDGLEAAIQDNATWQYSDFLLVEKNASAMYRAEDIVPSSTQRQSRAISFTDAIGEKLLHLAKGRTVRLKLPQAQTVLRIPDGISDAVEELSNTATTAKPITIPIHDNDEYNGALNGVAGLTNADEGRKKKDKDKHMASFGGMAMMAMMAQMFFGKVLMIAGTAFIMAKIALLVSLLGSLKKGATGNSGGSTDHVIVTSHGGGGHESPGWHRSMPYEVPKIEISQPEETHYDSPPVKYEHSSSGPPSPPSISHKPPSKNYYNYQMIQEHEVQDTGPGDTEAGGYIGHKTAGFL